MTRKVATYCYQCVAGPDLRTVKVHDGVATEVEPNFAAADVHPGGGKVCVKAYGLVQKAYHPGRVLQPMKRTNPRKGRDEDPGFVPISWDEALGEIVERLSKIREDHGPEAFATFVGNPSAYAMATNIWMAGMQDALGVKWRYCINSEDTAARMAASALVYGSCAILPKPDVWRTKFMMIIGSADMLQEK